MPEGEASRPPTARELEVLRMTSCGYSNKEIAAALSIALKTVEVHKSEGMRRLGLTSRRDLVQYAITHGWLKGEC